MATKKKTPATKKPAAPKAVARPSKAKAAAKKPAAAKSRAKAVAVVEEEIAGDSGNGAAHSGKALVIVESPAKAKTIGKYLGSGYSVKATVGHIRDLPTKTLGIGLDDGFEPEYVTIPGKEKTVADLKAAAKSARRASWDARRPLAEPARAAQHLGLDARRPRAEPGPGLGASLARWGAPRPARVPAARHIRLPDA